MEQITTPIPLPSNCDISPPCTPCVTCSTCTTCDTCDTGCSTGFTSIEDTCEKDPLYDAMSNGIAFKLCGDPRNPKIGVKVIRFTGDCETTGSCSTTGITYQTGYTITELCSPNSIYPECEQTNPAYLDLPHWFQFNAVWERYSYLDDCDLWYRGGLGDITKRFYLESLVNNSISLVKPPYTRINCDPAEEIDLVNLNEKWLLDKDYRKGRLKIYINGKLFWTIEDFEEIIPRALNTDKERQIGVPFSVSWGGGTQGLRENLVFSSPNQLLGNYIQDPECLPTNDLSGTSLSALTTNIQLEQNFACTFEGAISQFRMYVSPLSAPEVKHNFKLNYVQFKMFNPDCPDCNTIDCLTDDFTYEIVDTYGLGRGYSLDERDKKYLIKSILKPTTPTITSKYWNAEEWWGNQGNTPQCVGYAWAHWIEDGPVTHGGIPPIVNPTLVYREAQKIDEWPGEQYAGTSVRAGAKYLKNTGKISSYLWAYDLDTLVNTILTKSPVVVGTNWYNNMFYPDKFGIIRVGGRLAGGHAYVINGVDTKTKMFRMKNSWGRTWGQKGHAFISFTDMTRLIREQGEICLAIENNF